MTKYLEEYLHTSSEDESIPYFHISTKEEFTILPLLILSSYLKSIPEFSIKFDKVPTINQFDEISDVISKLPGLEITYITIKEVFLKYIASYEELDLTKIDQSWIELLLEMSEYVLQNSTKKTSNKSKSYYLQYRKRAEKLFLKGNIKGHSKLFVKLILENILKIIGEVWDTYHQTEKE